MEGIEEEAKISESHLTSAAAFVEGGVQEPCDDACSICLETFCESEPSTVTGCKHEFHLQCILEWCQRSSQCPMCWRPISLKDPTSQELLEAVEQERNIRQNPPRNATIFHHPTLGDFELQHLPVDANESELEERIIQHLAAAASMGRARHIARRDGHRNRSSAQGRPQLLVFSTPPGAPQAPPSMSQREGESLTAIAVATPSSPLILSQASSEVASPPSALRIPAANQHGSSVTNRRSPDQSSPSNQDGAGPSDFQSFSESVKSRLNAVSTRYKESISRSTRGWKERFFSRNTSIADIGSEVRREVNATVSRMMDRLEVRDNIRSENNVVASNSNIAEGGPLQEASSQQMLEAGGDSPIRDTNTNMQASCTTSSGSL